MATLYISEFKQLASIGTTVGQVFPQPPVATDQVVAIGATSTQSAAFSANTRVVLLCADVTCSFLFGDNPTALTTSMRLPADTPIPFAVQPGQKVAVIANT